MIIILTACLLIVAAACQNDKKDDSRAYYIYMCGSDLETNSAQASKDIAELAENLPAGVTVILQTGGTKNWRGYTIDASKIQRWQVTQDGLTLLESSGRANMGSAKTLSDFLEFCVSGYPAEHMSLLFWGHGNGEGVCEDELYQDDALNAREISAALNSLTQEVVFDTVVFDACYAATLDMAAAVAPNCGYMVASQQAIPGSGLDYSAIDFTAEDGLAFAKSVCDSFIASYSENSGVEMAVIAVEGIPDLAGAWDTAANSIAFAAIPEAYLTHDSYGRQLADIGGMLNMLPDDEKDVLESLVAKSVVYIVGGGEPGLSGLSVAVK